MSVIHRLRELVHSLGFDLMGIATVEPLVEAEAAIVERIQSGVLSGMAWMTVERARRGCRPWEIMPSARSIISVGMGYLSVPDSQPADELSGRVARYARAGDYHRVVKAKLAEVGRWLQANSPGPVETKPFVDSNPLPERAIAARAGLGWVGKNTNILTRKLGSWFFLGELLTSVDLPSGGPLALDCGRCDACIRACPTGALVAPYILDSRRCLSYLSIERHGAIPPELRPLLADRVFGCDACQESCPVSQRAQHRSGPIHRAGPPNEGVGPWLDLPSLFELDESAFQARFAQSPVRRAKRSGLLRNAAIILGNLGDGAALPALEQALADSDPIVRGHAAWAVGRIGGARARRMLEDSRRRESDAEVMAEVKRALGGSQP